MPAILFEREMQDHQSWQNIRDQHPAIWSAITLQVPAEHGATLARNAVVQAMIPSSGHVFWSQVDNAISYILSFAWSDRPYVLLCDNPDGYGVLQDQYGRPITHTTVEAVITQAFRAASDTRPLYRMGIGTFTSVNSYKSQSLPVEVLLAAMEP